MAKKGLPNKPICTRTPGYLHQNLPKDFQQPQMRDLSEESTSYSQHDVLANDRRRKPHALLNNFQFCFFEAGKSLFRETVAQTSALVSPDSLSG